MEGLVTVTVRGGVVALEWAMEVDGGKTHVNTVAKLDDLLGDTRNVPAACRSSPAISCCPRLLTQQLGEGIARWAVADCPIAPPPPPARFVMQSRLGMDVVCGPAWFGQGAPYVLGSGGGIGLHGWGFV